MTTILSLGAGKVQSHIINAARQLGYEVVTVDQNPDAPGHALADHALHLSTWEAGPILEALPCEVDAVLCRSAAQPVVTAAELCAELGLPGAPVDAAEVCIRKERTMRLADGLGLRTPGTSDKPPWVIKPNISAGGRAGVYIVRSAAHMAEVEKYSRGASHDGYALAERYVDGEDVTLLGLVVGGEYESLALIDETNLPDLDGSVKGLGYSYPSKYEGTATHEALVGMAFALQDELELVRSPLHLNARVTPDAPVLIEVHLDIGGDRLLEDTLPPSATTDVVRALVEG